VESPTVRTVGAADEDRAIATVVLAFVADPIARLTWSHAHDYLAAMPRFVRAFAGGAFTHRGALCTQDCLGAALWLPPGVHPDEEKLHELVESSVSPSIQGEFSTAFAEMAKHHPSEPHWYLPLIGVDPAYQGKGHGDALMAHALDRCDRDGVPAYLESTNPRNRSLYQRHGFEPLGTIRIGVLPPFVPMVRRAR
jgi:ribosomal protein S18 acetylase RimI-like enzyme